MGRMGSTVLASVYVAVSVWLLYAVAQDRESQGEFDERAGGGPYNWLLTLQWVASVGVGTAIETRWVLVLPLLVVGGGWTFAYQVAEGHAAADVLINTTIVAVGDLVAIGLGRFVRRYRGRSR
jgi:hypothetical protein